jgi:uncharacterized protein YfaP (DUF2135 family)
MIEDHNIKEKIKVSEFIKKIKNYCEENIESTDHTFFRLNQKKRKIYTEKMLKTIVFNDIPLEVSIEKNGNYAVIYNFNEGKNKLKILLSLSSKKVYIVTFYILNKDQERLFKNE